MIRCEPEEAVRAYHGDLQRLKIRPHRSLAEDLVLTPTAISYGGTATAKPGTRPDATANRSPAASGSAQEPDFSKMTAAEKVEWNLARWRRILGG